MPKEKNGGEGIDPEVENWKRLGYTDAHRDPQTGAVVTQMKAVVWQQIDEEKGMKGVRKVGKVVKRVVEGTGAVLRKIIKPRWPGKGASDEAWRKYARDKAELWAPGADVRIPKIRPGKDRGWDIYNLVRGETVELKWPCGCRQVGDDYFPCKSKSCVVNQDGE